MPHNIFLDHAWFYAAVATVRAIFRPDARLAVAALKAAIRQFPSNSGTSPIAAIRDYVHSLGQAKDFQEVLRIPAGFMHAQFGALVEQTRSLSEACVRTAADAANKPFKKAA